DFRGLRAGRHKVGALQQVIGIAEVDEFFSFLVNRHKSDIPSIGVGRILNFARRPMRAADSMTMPLMQ
ncbi:MAG: hypothetical protein WB052_01310, partial [Pseudolabrys sp.]